MKTKQITGRCLCGAFSVPVTLQNSKTWWSVASWCSEVRHLLHSRKKHYFVVVTHPKTRKVWCASVCSPTEEIQRLMDKLEPTFTAITAVQPQFFTHSLQNSSNWTRLDKELHISSPTTDFRLHLCLDFDLFSLEHIIWSKPFQYSFSGVCRPVVRLICPRL